MYFKKPENFCQQIQYKKKGLIREKPKVVESNIEGAESENRVEEVIFVIPDRIIFKIKFNMMAKHKK